MQKKSNKYLNWRDSSVSKALPPKNANLSADPRNHMKLDTAVRIWNPRAPSAGWEVEPEEPQEAHRPGGLA